MDNSFNLEQYLADGVENLVKYAIKATLTNPRESLFLSKYILSANKAAKLRENATQNGEHIPSFLIASITSKCNLHCAGCYARANHTCSDHANNIELTSVEWGRIFHQAEDMGISFILLAGGEPLMRHDVIDEATRHPDIIFPIFTNGTMLEEGYLHIFNKNRNLVPILSIEGSLKITDERRGQGMYRQLFAVMTGLDSKGILYGVSVTVTKENLTDVTSNIFLTELRNHGCKAIIYVEYVPVDDSTKALALSDEERQYLDCRLDVLRDVDDGMIFISFPGDEKASGGCLAAGRGFFHINAQGSAEPCPFSPYSDTNLKEKSLKEALHSPLFARLTSGELLTKKHDGGCVLFEYESTVKQLCSETAI